VYGYQGLYCIDSSIIPTSLGVNPSLTISAVSERCAERLVASAGELGLPHPRSAPAPLTPPQHVGERVIPKRPPAPRHKHRKHHKRRKHHKPAPRS
jgi:choline dehydrogenase-like flavoprotein